MSFNGKFKPWGYLGKLKDGNVNILLYFFQVSSYTYIKILLEKFSNSFVCRNDEVIIMKPKLKAQVAKLSDTSNSDCSWPSEAEHKILPNLNVLYKKCTKKDQGI